jgi:hypothetical protein
MTAPTIPTNAPEQEEIVTALAPFLPRYELTAEQWFDVMFTLRRISRTSNADPKVRLFLEDISRCADAMHNRLSGSEIYLGQAELDAVLGKV